MIDKVNDTTGHVPRRLMAVLEEEDVNKSMHWEPDGRAFTITHPKLFAATALKEHFKGVQFSSFIKNLRQWGFNMTGRKDAGRYLTYTFSSDLFIRDQPELCNSMHRMTKKDWKAHVLPKPKQRKVVSPPPRPSKTEPQPNRACSVMPVFVPCMPMQIGWPMQTFFLNNQYCYGVSGVKPSMDKQSTVKPSIQKRGYLKNEPYKNHKVIKSEPEKSRPKEEDTVTIRRRTNKVSITKDELSAVIGMTMLDSL